MSFDAFDTSAVREPRRAGIRNPANLTFLPQQKRAVAIRIPAAHLETLGLACLIAAAASAVPLVMLLHP